MMIRFFLTFGLLVVLPLYGQTTVNSVVSCKAIFSKATASVNLEVILSRISAWMELARKNNVHGTPFDRTVKAFHEMPYVIQARTPEILMFMTPDEIRVLANDSTATSLVLQQAKSYSGPNGAFIKMFQVALNLPTSALLFQNYAKLIHIQVQSPELFNRNRPMDVEELKRQADLISLPVETYPTAYRFESRAPDEIVSAKGFQSNPKVKVGTLLEHSMKVSMGAGWISLTLSEGNANVLTSAQIIGAKLDSIPSFLKEKGNFIAAIEYLNSKSLTMENMEIEKLYEYQVNDVQAVKPVEGLRIAEEVEIVTGGIPLSQIALFREVYIVRVKQLVNRAVERTEFLVFSDWQRLN